MDGASVLALWHFDRQMLAEGLRRPVGEGDVAIRPLGRYRPGHPGRVPPTSRLSCAARASSTATAGAATCGHRKPKGNRSFDRLRCTADGGTAQAPCL
ncbi:SsgA family sporulation/cell division regulator [Streptomyces sp. NPDC002886]|uniref:SsgA family sporulation/cell division regulator n=1 Tax=Streptomyces sp. NPDC002886 TaxID=3364667 RepID=UPI0036746D3A